MSYPKSLFKRDAGNLVERVASDQAGEQAALDQGFREIEGVPEVAQPSARAPDREPEQEATPARFSRKKT